ncbi:molybdenum cofactor biosynthesis protein MoaE [Chloroflexota bacterium]
MVGITDKQIYPEDIVHKVKTDNSGCVATYIGLIRNTNHDKPVASVEYIDSDGTAEDGLKQIEDEVRQKWPVNNIALVHRLGKLNVGDINLVIAIACGHRQEGFAACQYAVDRFKEIMPAKKRETYSDGSVWGS